MTVVDVSDLAKGKPHHALPPRLNTRMTAFAKASPSARELDDLAVVGVENPK